MKLIAIILLLLNAIPALYGGYSMIHDPSGYAMDMPIEWLQNGPFYDYYLPGLFLFCVNGIGNLLIIMLLLIDIARFYYALIIAGAVLVLWILVEIAIIQQFSWLQQFYLVVGLFMILCGGYLRKHFVML